MIVLMARLCWLTRDINILFIPSSFKPKFTDTYKHMSTYWGVHPHKIPAITCHIYLQHYVYWKLKTQYLIRILSISLLPWAFWLEGGETNGEHVDIMIMFDGLSTHEYFCSTTINYVCTHRDSICNWAWNRICLHGIIAVMSLRKGILFFFFSMQKLFLWQLKKTTDESGRIKPVKDLFWEKSFCSSHKIIACVHEVCIFQ